MIRVLFEYKYSVVYRTFHITTLSRNGDLLTEAFYVYHPIKYQHILFVIIHIYAFLKYLIL